MFVSDPMLSRWPRNLFPFPKRSRKTKHRQRKGVRVCLRSDAFKIDPESLSLSEKVQKDEASAREIERYRQLQQERVENILKADTESLFKIEEITPEIPAKARIMDSGICDF